MSGYSVIVTGGGFEKDVVGDVETESVENIVGFTGFAEGVVEPVGDLEEHGDSVCDWQGPYGGKPMWNYGVIMEYI